MSEMLKITDSVFHSMYDELVLMGEKDGVNEAMYIKDLQEIIANLTSAIESGKPVCPYCKAEMCPTMHSHYYSDGEYPIWTCNCDEFPKEANSERWHSGY